MTATIPQTNEIQSNNQRQSTSDGVIYQRFKPHHCYTCGEPGYFSRECPHRQQQIINTRTYHISTELNNQHVKNDSAAQSQTPSVSMIPVASLHCSSVLASAITSSTATKLPTYRDGLINGNKTPFLIDTGCETCILPSSLVKNEALTKCGTRMTAANGTPIASLGMIDL
jgi:hypothetical protein